MHIVLRPLDDLPAKKQVFSFSASLLFFLIITLFVFIISSEWKRKKQKRRARQRRTERFREKGTTRNDKIF